jgi:hypothetical protein
MSFSGDLNLDFQSAVEDWYCFLPNLTVDSRHCRKVCNSGVGVTASLADDKKEVVLRLQSGKFFIDHNSDFCG